MTKLLCGSSFWRRAIHSRRAHWPAAFCQRRRRLGDSPAKEKAEDEPGPKPEPEPEPEGSEPEADGDGEGEGETEAEGGGNIASRFRLHCFLSCFSDPEGRLCNHGAAPVCAWRIERRGVDGTDCEV